MRVPAWFESWKPNLRMSRPELFVLAVMIPIGMLVVFLVPIGAGTDEETHIARVWEMSALEFIPNERLGDPSTPYPMLLREVSYRRQVLIRPVSSDFWLEYGSAPIDGNGYYYGPMKTRSVYSPTLLLPQAFVMRYLGTKLGFSFLTVYYSARIAGLFSYIALAWLAVRSIPLGKWTLAILAVSPLALFQASTVTADSISNGIGLLFTGACLAVCLRKQIRMRDLLTLLALTALLFTAKINLVALALLPFVLLRPSDFSMRGGYALLALGTLLLLAVEVGGWNLAAYPRVQSSMQEGAGPVGQLSHIFADPLRFVWLLVSDLWSNGVLYLRAWIAGYGHDYWSVPVPAFFLFIFAVIASLFIRSTTGEPTRRTRLGLVSVFIAGYLLTATVLYVAFSPVAARTISGMHGKNLLAIMAPLALAGVGLVSPLRVHWSRWAAGGAVAGLLLFVGGAALSYHVLCGPQVYQRGLCYQPYYKNWAPSENMSQPLNPGVELTQEIIPECSGLTEVRAWMSASKDASGSTTLTIVDALRSFELARKTVAHADLVEPGWQSLEFKPEWDSDGHRYLLIIRGEKGTPGPHVGLTIRPENPTMMFWKDGEESNLDLFFQYGCLAGLESLLR